MHARARPRHRIAEAGVFLTALAIPACLVTIDESRLREASPIDLPDTFAGADNADGRASDAGEDTNDAALGDGSSAEAGPVGRSCAPVLVKWKAPSANENCEGRMTEPLPDGATLRLVGAGTGETGVITLRCDDGMLTQSDPRCHDPKPISLGPNDCGGAQCIASVTCAGQPPSDRAAMANLACQVRGFGVAVSSSLATPTFSGACRPDGTQCFTITDTTCITILASVKCRY